MPLKVLILVCTYLKPPFDLFYKAQKETWDSIPHPYIETVYYDGEGNNEWVDGNLFLSDCPEGYYTQHWKHRQAINAVWDKEWDIVFRTASSSYVNKEELYRFCQTLFIEKLWGGWILGDGLPDMEWMGHTIQQRCVSGAGQFYSRDVANTLRKVLPDGVNFEEDVLSTRLLQINGFPITLRTNGHRVDLCKSGLTDYRPSYHYRIKTADRYADVQTMYQLHKFITTK